MIDLRDRLAELRKGEATSALPWALFVFFSTLVAMIIMNAMPVGLVLAFFLGAVAWIYGPQVQQAVEPHIRSALAIAAPPAKKDVVVEGEVSVVVTEVPAAVEEEEEHSRSDVEEASRGVDPEIEELIKHARKVAGEEDVVEPKKMVRISVEEAQSGLEDAEEGEEEEVVVVAGSKKEAVRAMFKDAKFDVRTIAKRLDISVDEVVQAIRDML